MTLSRNYPARAEPHFWRALGCRFARFWFKADPSAARLGWNVERELRLHGGSGDQRGWFCEGVGSFLSVEWYNDGREPGFDAELLSELPAELRPAVLRGAGMKSELDQLFETRFLVARRRAEFLRGLGAAEAEAFDGGRAYVFAAFETARP